MGIISRVRDIRISLAKRFGDAVAAFAGTPPQAKAASGQPTMAGMQAGMFAGTGIAQWAGVPLNQVTHYRHWVYRAIDCISRTVAKETPRVAWVRTPEEAKFYRAKVNRHIRAGKSLPPEEHRRFLGRMERIKALGAFRASDQLEDVPSDHPLVQLLANPNPYDAPTTPWYEIVMFLELTGVAYLWPVPNSGTGGPFAELWALPSQWVEPVHQPGSGRIIDHYEVRAFGVGSSAAKVRFATDELIQFRFPSPLSKMVGQSPLQAAAELVDVHESILWSRFFSMKNGANVGATITLGPDFNPDDGELERFRSKWLSRAQGERGFETPMVLPPGATIDRGNAERELAFNASMIQTRDEILALFGVPKNVANIIDGVNRANNIAAHEQFYANTTNPISRMVMSTATKSLASRYERNLAMYAEDQRVADPDQTRMDFEVGLRFGCCTPNEYRAEVLHLEDFAFGGDDPILPMGMSPLPIGTGDGLDDLDLTAAGLLDQGTEGARRVGEHTDLGDDDASDELKP